MDCLSNRARILIRRLGHVHYSFNHAVKTTLSVEPEVDETPANPPVTENKPSVPEAPAPEAPAVPAPDIPVPAPAPEIPAPELESSMAQQPAAEDDVPLNKGTV